jgi:ABC-type transporter Mla maintaining outer membrane lipid asymmetry ATPase subunit MlaF
VRECRVADFFSSPPPRQVIVVEGVGVSLDGHKVLENISFALDEGTFLGVIGPNGAGKTTLVRVILGLIKPDKGFISVMGMSPDELKHELHHIGYMPQQVLFDPLFPVSVYDVVMMGRTCCIGMFRFPRRDDREAVMKSIEAVGLKGWAAEARLSGPGPLSGDPYPYPGRTHRRFGYRGPGEIHVPAQQVKGGTRAHHRFHLP